MKNLKKIKEKFSTKSLTKAQSNYLKGGDDKRKGPSGDGGIPPGTDSPLGESL